MRRGCSISLAGDGGVRHGAGRWSVLNRRQAVAEKSALRFEY